MKIIARFPVELNGHIYHKGESCSYEGAVTRRIAANFTDADGNALTAADAPPPATAHNSAVDPAEDKDTANKTALRRTIEVMGRDGIRRALDAMNVAYSPNTGTEYLAKTLLIARGEYAE